MWIVALLAVAKLGQPCLPIEQGHDVLPVQVQPRLPPPPAPPPPPPPAPLPPPAPPLAGPLLREERAHYRIAFGILGQLGQLTISQSPATTSGGVMRVAAQAQGSLLGFGQTDKRLDTELDPRSLAARRWTAVRTSGGKSVIDFAQQPQPGALAMMRRRTGKPDQPAALKRAVPVLDPLTFLLRLRVTPPSAVQRFEVIDGQALWLITMIPARIETDGAGRALRLDGKAEPITWDGGPDDDRGSHAFSLWLSTDQFHTPLRLVMPLAVGAARADLVGLSRGRPPSRVTPHPATQLTQARSLASP